MATSSEHSSLRGPLGKPPHRHSGCHTGSCSHSAFPPPEPCTQSSRGAAASAWGEVLGSQFPSTEVQPPRPSDAQARHAALPPAHRRACLEGHDGLRCRENDSHRMPLAQVMSSLKKETSSGPGPAAPCLQALSATLASWLGRQHLLLAERSAGRPYA